MYDEQFSYGHGGKSVYLIGKHIKLTDQELPYSAIGGRWQIFNFDAYRSFLWLLHDEASTYLDDILKMTQGANFLLRNHLSRHGYGGLKLENGYDDFLKTLRREPIQQTKAMLEGIRFENCLNAVLDSAEIEPTHEWYKPIMELYPTLYRVTTTSVAIVRNGD